MFILHTKKGSLTHLVKKSLEQQHQECPMVNACTYIGVSSWPHLTSSFSVSSSCLEGLFLISFHLILCPHTYPRLTLQESLSGTAQSSSKGPLASKKSGTQLDIVPSGLKQPALLTTYWAMGVAQGFNQGRGERNSKLF